ncbi:hypothetical protein FV232_09745 [Methylobacterium sp. WL30]|uniref:hypothetical protein n=1 Tax=unclassified Methylobacterium TaxID=2615210 RepID=UPI0011C87E77|nr:MULTISPECIES: hypothetical protein [unclassified Methylobacterium]TXN41265.1 hypothetical protein FV225_03065 [Methylobacterium sp. WL93]TXN50950.1 hypothetical protein FV227_09820 [Methylobacterium sp. WL119]TXN68167.1 hypothetical protein FV232_09745 [Methylobacterium sp. WL30]
MALTHAIVDRGTSLIVSRHGSLTLARKAWRRHATVLQGGRIVLLPWAARHMVVPLSVANAALARLRSSPVQRVTASSHPHVHRAFGIVAEDAGESPRFEYLVPRAFEHRLGQAEVALGELDEAGFETLCLGSPSAVRALIGRDEGRRAAADLLAGFFSDWHPLTHAGIAPSPRPSA